MSNGAAPGGRRGNTIGQSAGQLRETLERYERSTGSKADRRYTRMPFRAVSLPVTLKHPGGTEVALRLACRNISRRGMGFLHSAFVYPGTQLRVRMPKLDGTVVSVTGTAVRCDHREGVVHELGVRLDEPIELNEFLRSLPLREPLSFENVKPEEVRGTLVYLDTAQHNVRVVKHFLRESSVRVREVTSSDAAIEEARMGCDLVLVAAETGAPSQPDAIRALRDAGINAPILATGPELNDEQTGGLLAASVDAYIESPFDQHALLRSVAEFLLEPRQRTDQARDQQTAAVLLAQLNELGSTLTERAQADSTMDSYVISQQIQRTAGMLGLTQASAVAGRLATALSGGASPKALGVEIQKLAQMCAGERQAA